MLNCGEVALVVERDGEAIKFVSYTLPRRGENFEEGELRNAFLAQGMGNKCFEDSDREILSAYLNASVLGKKKDDQETRSVYKYKPVTLEDEASDWRVAWRVQNSKDDRRGSIIGHAEVIDDAI